MASRPSPYYRVPPRRRVMPMPHGGPPEALIAELNSLLRELRGIQQKQKAPIPTARVVYGPKGDKGDRGEPGRSVAGPIGRSGRDGRDGMDATPLDPLEVAEAIKEGKLLHVKHIQGLREEIDSYRNQLAGKHYGADTWARGGGDTVAAGSGITITSSNGVKTISATGGSPDVATESLTPTASGDNITLDLTGLSNPFVTILGVYRNGQLLSSGSAAGADGSSRQNRVGNTITVFNAATSDFYQVQYTF